MSKVAVKTHMLKSFRDALDIANDVTCFQGFIHDDFEKTAALLYDKHQAELASSAFPNNPVAHRVNLTKDAILDLNSNSLKLGFSHGLMSSIEYVLSYCKEVQVVLKLHHNISLVGVGDLGEEERLEGLLGQITTNNNHRNIFRTITYFRYVRNHIAHARVEPVKSMSKFSKQNADVLNKFWREKPAKLADFDFATFDVRKSSMEEILASISMMRISLVEIDVFVAGLLRIENLVYEEHAAVTLGKPSLVGSKERVSKKVQSRLKQTYGLELTVDEISEHLN